jgi:hypothetical protein
MTKIRMLGATVLLLTTLGAPVFAQDGGMLGTHNGWEPSSSVNGERPGVNVMRNSESSGMSNSEMTEPGDFAVTGGQSDGRTGNLEGQVDPGTSNAPCGNCGGQ